MSWYLWPLVWLIGFTIMIYLKIDWRKVIIFTIGLLLIIIVESSSIRKIVMGKTGIELEKQQEKINQALVEYDEFKKTIFPILESSMSQITSGIFQGRPPKTDVLIDYLPRIKKVIDVSGFNNSVLSQLYEAAKCMTIDEYATELNLIAVHGLHNNGNTEVLKFVNAGIIGDYSSSNYVNKDKIFVSFNKLEDFGKRLPNGSYKERYNKKLEEFRKFYKEYFW